MMGTKEYVLHGNQQFIKVDSRPVLTLKDILPEYGPIKMLILDKTPAPESVSVGHYFQGKQGRMFWSMLDKNGLLSVPANQYEDDFLISHGYGITDLVKVPHEYANEPTGKEYRQGIEHITNVINCLLPQVVMFVYKRVLDKILDGPGKPIRTTYGFNPNCDHIFNSRVFVFPMPGTPCTKTQQISAMSDLAALLLHL